MTTKTAGEILRKMRLQGATSLNRLERLTGRNRASILRYERGELPITKRFATAASKVIWSKRQDQDSFIRLCEEERTSRKQWRKNMRERKKYRTLASKVYQIVLKSKIFVRSVSDIPDGMMSENLRSRIRNSIKPGTTSFPIVAVEIIEKQSGLNVGGLEREGFYFQEHTGEEAIEALIRFAIKNKYKGKVGLYALLDLMRKTVERSDIFSFNEDDTVVLGKQDFAFFTELIGKAKEVADPETKNGYLERLRIQIECYKARKDAMQKERIRLLKTIDDLCVKVQQVFQPSLLTA